MTVYEITQPYIETSTLVGGFTLTLAECAITLYSNSEVLLEELIVYYNEFSTASDQVTLEKLSKGEVVDSGIKIYALEQSPPSWDLNFTIKQPDPGKSKIKEEFIDFVDGRMVRKRLTEMVFAFGYEKKGAALNVALGPCEKNPNQIVNFINNRFIQWALHRNYLLCHAAAVEYNNVGIAVAGFSGMGKSTFALKLMSAGALFISNDRLLIKRHDSGVSMLGVPKLPRINPGTILNNKNLQQILSDEEHHEFSEMEEEELWGLEQKYDVYINEAFGNKKIKLDTMLDRFYILHWNRGEEQQHVSPVSLDERLDLLPAFMKQPGLFYLSPDKKSVRTSEADYIKELDATNVYEIHGALDFEQACEQIFASLH